MAGAGHDYPPPNTRPRFHKDALALHPDEQGGSTVKCQEVRWAYETAMAVLDARERGEAVPPRG